MKREDLDTEIKEKLLFSGISGTGKTNICLRIAKLWAIAGKKVLYIDPEDGTDKDLKNIFDDLKDEELKRIDIKHANNIDNYLKLMYGLREEVQIGSNQTVTKTHYLDYDLKICDGLTTEIEQFKFKLIKKYVDQGYYEIGGKKFYIKDPDTFVLPYQFYAKLYDQIVQVLYVMLEHGYSLICTTHPFRDTDAQQYLKENIYKKFDSVVIFEKLIKPDGYPNWSGRIIKNRGKESTDKKNILPTLDPLIIYFIKKFNMDIKEIGERVGIIMEE